MNRSTVSRTTVLLVILSMVLILAGMAMSDPSYIYGMHEFGGESYMANAGAKGWILDTQALGHDPNNYAGYNYSTYTNQGYGVISRLNEGYGGQGTLPFQSQYQNFAQRCANFVANSPGCHIWIIGNETNCPCEWPGNVNGDPLTGEPITISRYADCFNRCYNAITALSGHAGDQIIPAPVCTYAPPYSAQGVEAFDDYFVNMLNTLGTSKVKAIALHTYTHGTDPNLVFSEALMDPPYQDIHYNFRVYKDYMNRIPTGMRTLPVYITETGELFGWANSNNGWVKNCYSEINSWNTSHTQKIRAVCLYRWPNADVSCISCCGGVIQDWVDSMANKYQWTVGTAGTISGTVKDTFNVPVSGANVSTSGYSANTDSNGNYTISNVVAGTYSVTAAAGGFNSQTITNVVVTSGQVTTKNFNIQSTTGMTPTTPGGTNLATSASATTDSNYDATFTGAKAIDGVISAASKWCTANTAPPHWLALDLGTNQVVNGFIVYHAGAAGENVLTNNKNFQIQSATSLSGPWTNEVVIDNTAQANSNACTYPVPKTLRYVRLYITNCGIDNYARVPEFKVYCASSGMNGNTPTGTNVSPLSSQVTTDSNFSSSYDGTKAIDTILTQASKWCSANVAPPHWLALDLGANRTLNGFIVYHAGSEGENASGNTKNFQIQSATSMSGPWTDEIAINNSAQANSSACSYVVPKSLRYVRLYITNPGVDNYARIPEFQAFANSGTVSENYETMPAFTSTYDAAWGSAATWSIVAGGQSANNLQALRASQGSSAKVMVYGVSANTNITITVYLKCPNYSGSYWMETSYKLGNNTAQDFDANSTTWTAIKNFADTGTNGNGGVWTQYTATLNTGSNTQISIGFKHGASGCVGPTMGWDTLRIN